MNLDRFVAALVKTGLCAEAEEIADVVLLMLHGQRSATSGLSRDAGGETDVTTAGRGEAPPEAESAKPPENLSVDQAGLPPDGPPPPTKLQPEPNQSLLYTATKGQTGTRRAHMLRVPTAPALPNALALGRALRPFMRRMPSPIRSVLDETASAERIAELRLPIPVFRPMPERIFDVALVVEMSGGMTVWHRTVVEFEHLLLRHGAFRDVRRWQISWQKENATAQLHDAAREKREWRAVSQTPGNRLVLVATDGASEAWRNGAWADILHDWSMKSVAIVQLLGERLTERTPMGYPNARLMPSVPSAPNNVYLVDLPPWQLYGPEPRVTVPVIFLDGDSASRWARATMGASVTARGVSLASRDESPFDEAPTHLPVNEPASPGARLRRFVQLASPEARELAAFLSAVPLTQPVMRLVQQVMMEKICNEHLAEVLLGGILERVTPADAMVDPDQVEFDFVAGVRELLQTSMTRAELARVLTCASEYVDVHFGQPLDFKALVEAQDGALELPEGALPFAQIARQALGQFRPLPEMRSLPKASAERARTATQRPPEAMLTCCMRVGTRGSDSLRTAFAVAPETFITVRVPYKNTPFLVVEGSSRSLQFIQGITRKDAARKKDRIVALRSVGWTVDEYLRTGGPAPDGEVSVSVTGFDDTHPRWFDCFLQARSGASSGPRFGLVVGPPDLADDALAAVFVGAPVLLNEEVVGVVVDVVRSEINAALLRIVESDYLLRILDRLKPYVALFTDNDLVIEIIRNSLSALPGHVSRFPGVDRFVGMTVRTYSASKRGLGECLDESTRSAPGLVILASADRRGMPIDSAGSPMLDRLTAAFPDVLILVLTSTGIFEHGPLREMRKIRALDIDVSGASDFSFDFAKVLHNACRFPSARQRLTLWVGLSHARYSLTQGEDEWSRGEYGYQDNVLELLNAVKRYADNADGGVARDWKRLTELGHLIYRYFISKTIGEYIEWHHHSGLRGPQALELRFVFELEAIEAVRLFDVPFELALPFGNEIGLPLCLLVPMARRIRSRLSADVKNSNHSVTAPGSEKRPMRMLFIDPACREAEFEREGTKLRMSLSRLESPLRAFGELFDHKGLLDIEVVSGRVANANVRDLVETVVRQQPFDILHFSGPLVDRAGDDAYVFLPGENGVGQAISVREVANWVHDSGIRIVTFSSFSGSFFRTCAELLAGGAETVLGLRDINDSFASMYLQRFYRLYLEQGSSASEAHCGAYRVAENSTRGAAILVVKD
ncbi:hypothetical protein CBA19CS11_35830 [Caballeronia novacaledonica]|uniref:SAV_2336 N-terminal domain-related protein n=1 Tax=Caballeronia novacaledonica TaxID=1544861 RepID=UPI001EE2DCAD|nr:SAV_2336 N-terminal domain-related protein [Caballeronia novacaledonica]GJH14326.1 hypothetical protein CBA19CS11_35830 [Caballeronia novacaledonica]